MSMGLGHTRVSGLGASQRLGPVADTGNAFDQIEHSQHKELLGLGPDSHQVLLARMLMGKGQQDRFGMLVDV